MACLPLLPAHGGGDASRLPPACPLLPRRSVRNSQKRKHRNTNPRPGCRGLSQSVWRDKAKASVTQDRSAGFSRWNDLCVQWICDL